MEIAAPGRLSHISPPWCRRNTNMGKNGSWSEILDCVQDQVSIWRPNSYSGGCMQTGEFHRKWSMGAGALWCRGYNTHIWWYVVWDYNVWSKVVFSHHLKDNASRAATRSLHTCESICNRQSHLQSPFSAPLWACALHWCYNRWLHDKPEAWTCAGDPSSDINSHSTSFSQYQ